MLPVEKIEKWDVGLDIDRSTNTYRPETNFSMGVHDKIRVLNQNDHLTCIERVS